MELEVEGWKLEVDVVEMVEMVFIEDWEMLELSRIKVHLLLVNYIRRIDLILQRTTLCQWNWKQVSWISVKHTEPIYRGS